MCLVLIQIGPVVFAASREWHDQLGNSIRAEFTGVVDGQVVLKSGTGALLALIVFGIRKLFF